MAVTDGLTPRQQELYAQLQAAMGEDGEMASEQAITPTIPGTDDRLGAPFTMSEPPAGDPPAASAPGGEGGTAATASPQLSPGDGPDMAALIAKHTGADDEESVDDDEGMVIIDEDEDEAAAPAGSAPDGTEKEGVSSGPDLGAVWESHYGRRPTVDEVVDYLGVVDALNQATPQQRALIAQVLQGYDPSASPSPGSPGMPAAPQPPSGAAGPAGDAPKLIPVDPYADETTKAAIEAMNANIVATHERLTAYEQQAQLQAQQQAQATLEARNQLIINGVQRARESFYQEHPVFTPEQQVKIERLVRNDGRFPVMLQLDPTTQMPRNDPQDVAAKVYSMIVHEDPELAAAVANSSTAATEQATRDAERKKKSTSISGRSAAIPSHRATGGREKGMAGLKSALDDIFAGNDPTE